MGLGKIEKRVVDSGPAQLGRRNNRRTLLRRGRRRIQRASNRQSRRKRIRTGQQTTAILNHLPLPNAPFPNPHLHSSSEHLHPLCLRFPPTRLQSQSRRQILRRPGRREREPSRRPTSFSRRKIRRFWKPASGSAEAGCCVTGLR
jgi:hypothetical protein